MRNFQNLGRMQNKQDTQKLVLVSHSILSTLPFSIFWKIRLIILIEFNHQHETLETLNFQCRSLKVMNLHNKVFVFF